MIGTVIGNYRIVRELGQGGMGAVYEGIDVMVERPVAIKMLRPEIAGNPDVIERFRVEAVTLARLNHPCIATLYSFFRESDSYYMVMEFVRGETMESLILRSQRLAPEFAAEIAAHTLDGMAHAQAMGVLHRDIKPANIMITGEGRVKVTDFGIARVLGSSRMTRDGRIIGTLEYLAPERIRGEEADIRSDLYSVGVVMYEAVSGRLPFTANTDYDLMQAHLNQAPPPLPSLGLQCPSWIQEILDRALAKSREDRFQSPEEFRSALAAGGARTIAQIVATPMTSKDDPMNARRISGKADTPATQTAAPGGPLNNIPLKRVMYTAAALFVLIGLILAINSYRSIHTETEPMVVSTPQPVQSPLQPLAPAEPSKQAMTAEAGRVLPLEMFQNRVSEAPRNQIRISPRERVSREDIMELEIPAEPLEKSALTTEARRENRPPANASASDAARPAEAEPSPTAVPPVQASTSANKKPLQDIRRIFVESMPDQLDEYIRSEIDKQLLGRVRLVSRREDADALLQAGKDENTGSATLTELTGNVVLWKDAVGDRSSLLGITKRGGSKKIAERLINSLKRKMNE